MQHLQNHLLKGVHWQYHNAECRQQGALIMTMRKYNQPDSMTDWQDKTGDCGSAVHEAAHLKVALHQTEAHILAGALTRR